MHLQTHSHRKGDEYPSNARVRSLSLCLIVLTRNLLWFEVFYFLRRRFLWRFVIGLQFLLRDAMRKRGLYSLLSAGVRLSVRLSVCHVGRLYLDGWIYRKTSIRPGSPITLVFRLPTPIPNSKRGQNTRGWEKLAIFDRNRHLSRKRYEIGPCLLWNVDRKS